ncbi:MAG: hypothetical protein K2H38_07290 [Muribaculaceae bacterium]|nr:hypothetical protein [Muribaculaceae bacterium]
MKIKFFFFLLCVSLISWVSVAQTTVTDAMVHEIITECVSKTGGFIVREEIKDNLDKETHIALPKDYNHYVITKTLRSLMIEIENYYYPVKSWKVLDNGYLCSFHIAKDASKRSLLFVYRPDNGSLVILDSPNNSINISMPESFVDKLQNAVVWGAVNLLGGFIREETLENISPVDIQYRVFIQLQKDATSASVVSELKPVSIMLETAYYLAEAWKQDENAGLECEFFAQLENEKKNMMIYFYYLPKSQVLTINFVTGPAE